MVLQKKEDGFVRMLDGVVRQNLVFGERTHLVKFLLSRGKRIPLHSHPQEQTGYLVSGKMVMVIEGKRYELEEGASWSIAGNQEHEVDVVEDCIVLEVFSPPRNDYMDEINASVK